MSVIVGGGMWLDYNESEITCPICTAVYDISDKLEASKYPVFNMRCKKCKGKITVSDPIMGGELEVWETDCPPTVERLRTTTPNKVNGIVPREKIPGLDFNDDDDEDEDDEWTPKPKQPKTV